MSWLKKIAVVAGGSVLGLTVLTAGGTGLLLGTTTGSALLLNKVAALLEGTVNLKGEIVDGSLFSGFKIAGPFEVEVPEVVRVSSDELELDYDLPGFLSSRILNINKLKAPGLKVELLVDTNAPAAEEPVPEAADSAPFRLNIPLHILLSSLESTDFAYLSQIVDVEAKKLELSLEVNGDYAAVQGGVIEDVGVHLKDSDSEPVAEPETAAPEPSFEELAALAVFGGGSEPLGPVDLPLDADLHNLKVRRGRYYMSVFDTGLVDFDLDAEWRHTKLQVKKLDAEHAFGKFSLNGDMLFEDYFGLDFTLTGEGASTDVTRQLFEGALYGLKGSARITGSLADINLKADITAPQPFNTSLRFNCLSPALTLDLELAASQLRYPLLSGDYLNLPEGSLSSLNTAANAAAGGPAGNGAAGADVAGTSAVSEYVPRLNLPSEQGNEIVLKDLHLKGSGTLMTGVNTELGGNLTGFGFKGVETELKGTLGIAENFVQHLGLKGGYSAVPESHSLFELCADNLKLTGSEPGTGGSLSFESPDASAFSTQLNGRASLKAEGLNVGYFGEKVVLNLGKLDAGFVLNSLKAQAAAADISGDLENGLDIGSLKFIQGNNHADVSGRLGHDSNLAGNFSLPRLNLIHQALEGALQGNFSVDGDYLQPKVQLAVNSSKEFKAGGLELNNLKIDADIDAREWTAKVDASSDYVKFSDALQPSGKCKVHASGTRASHSLELDCEGINGGTLSLSGGLDDHFSVWEGDLNALAFSSEYTSPLSLQEPVHAKVTLGELHGEVSPLEIAGEQGRVRLEKSEFTADSLHSALKVTELKLGSFARFLPEGLILEGTPLNLTAGSIDVKFKPDSVPDIKADLELDAGSGCFALELKPDTSQDDLKAATGDDAPGSMAVPGLELPWEGLKLTALLDRDAWTVQQLDFSFTDGNGTLKQDPKTPLCLHDPLGKGELSGKILLEGLNLGLLSSLAGQNLEGRVALETVLGGTLTAPSASSTLKSSFGGFGLSDVQAELKVQSGLEASTLDSLAIDGRYGSTPFTLKAGGKLVYAHDPGFDGNLTLESTDASGLAPQLNGKFSLSAQQIHAALAGTTPVLKLEKLNTDFVLNSLPSNLQVRGVSGDLGRGFDVEALEFRQHGNEGKNNTLNLSGKLRRAQSSFGGRIDLQSLAALHSTLDGVLTGELKLNGDFMRPSVLVSAQSDSLGAAGVVLKNLDVDAGISLANASPLVTLSVLSDSIKFSESMQPSGKCALVAGGWLPGHNLALNCEGQNGAVISLNGGLDEQLTRWAGDLEALSLSSEFSGALALEEAVHAEVQLDELEGKVGLIKLSGDPGSICIGAANLDSAVPDGGSGSWFNLKDVRSGLDFSLPELSSIPVLRDLLAGELKGNLSISGPLLQPEVTLEVNSPEFNAAGTSLSDLKLNAKVVTRKKETGVAAVTGAAHTAADAVVSLAAYVEEPGAPQTFDLGSQHLDLSIVSDSVTFSDALKPAGKCTIDVSGWISRHSLEAVCDGENGGSVKLTGSLDEDFTAWDGELSSLSVRSQYTSPLDLQHEVPAKIRLDELQGEVKPLELAGKAGIISLGASRFTTQSLHSSLKVTDLKLEDFAGLFLPSELGLRGGEIILDAGTVDVSFKPNAVPDIHAGLKLDIGSGTFKTAALELPWDGLHVDASLQPEEWSADLRFALAAENESTGPALKVEQLKLEDPLGEGKLSGKFSLDDVVLERFKAAGGIFSTLKGTAGIQGGSLGGSLKLPLLFQETPDTAGALRNILIYGTVTATGSAEPCAGMGLGRVEKFDFKLTADGNSGRVDNCLIRFGEGQELSLDVGTVDWKIDGSSTKLSSQLQGKVSLPQLESVHQSLAGILNGSVKGNGEIIITRGAPLDIDADFELDVGPGSFAYKFTDPAAAGSCAASPALPDSPAASQAPAGQVPAASPAVPATRESGGNRGEVSGKESGEESIFAAVAQPAGAAAAADVSAAAPEASAAAAGAATSDAAVLSAVGPAGSDSQAGPADVLAEDVASGTPDAAPAKTVAAVPVAAREGSAGENGASEDGALTLANGSCTPPRKLEFGYDSLQVKAGMHGGLLKVNGDFALSEKNGALHSELRITDPLGDGERAGKLAGELSLEPLNLGLFTAALVGVFNRMEGTASISNGKFDGTLSNPLFLGTIEVNGSAEPLFDPGKLHKFGLELKTSGGLDSVNLDGNMNLLGLDAGGSTGQEQAETSNGRLKTSLRITNPFGQGMEAGALSGAISLKDLNLKLFSAAGGVFEDLNGTAELTGTEGTGDGRVYGTLAAPRFDGLLAVNGRAKFKQELGVGEVEKLNLKVKSLGSRAVFSPDTVIMFPEHNELSLSGSVDWGSGPDEAMRLTSQGLKLNVSLPELNKVHALLGGDLKGTISLKDGDLLHPDVNVKLDSSTLQAADALTVTAPVLTARVNLGASGADARLQLLTDSLKFAEGLKPVGKCTVNASGWLSSHRLDFNCAGENRALVKVQGGLKAENTLWEGDLSAFEVATEFTGDPFVLKDKVHARVRLDQLEGTITPVTLAGNQGSISIASFVREKGKVTLKPSKFSLKENVLSGVEISVPELEALPVLKGMLAGTIAGRLQVGLPSGMGAASGEVKSGDLHSAPGGSKNHTAGTAGVEEDPLAALLGGLNLDLRVNADNLLLKGNVSGTMAGWLHVSTLPKNHVTQSEVKAADTQAADTGASTPNAAGSLNLPIPVRDLVSALKVDLNVTADNIKASDSLEPIRSCALGLSGMLSDHHLNLNCGRGGKNGARLSLAGKAADDISKWTGTLENLNLYSQYSSPMELKGQVTTDISLKDFSGTVSPVELVSELGTLMIGEKGQGSAHKQGQPGQQPGQKNTKFSFNPLTVKIPAVAVTGMQLSKLSRYLPENIKLRGGLVKTLEADGIEVKMGEDVLDAKGTVKLDIGHGVFAYPDMDLNLRYDRVAVEAGINKEALTVKNVALVLSGKKPGAAGSELALNDFKLLSPLQGILTDSPKPETSGPKPKHAGENPEGQEPEHSEMARKLSGKRIASGHLVLKDLDLELFSALGGQFNELKGVAGGDFRLGGALGAPRLDGVAVLKGTAEPRYDVGRAQQFDLQLTALGHIGKVDGQIMFNGGLFNLHADLDWGKRAEGGFELKMLELKSSGLPVSAMGYGTCLLDIDLKTKLGKIFDLEGKIGIPGCNIDVSRLGSGGSMPSADAVVISDEGISAVMQEHADTGGAPPLDGNINLTVELGKNIKFSAPEGLKGRIEGSLKIEKTAGEGSINDISGDGAISVVDCKSGEFWVNRADLIFNGPLSEPNIYLEIIRNPFSVENHAEAGLKVDGKIMGSAATLKPQFFSNTAMRQEEIAKLMQPLLVSMDTFGIALGGAAGQFSNMMNNIPLGLEMGLSGDQANVRTRIGDKAVLSYGYRLADGTQELKLMRELGWTGLYGEVASSVQVAVSLIYSFRIGEFFQKESDSKNKSDSNRGN